MNLKAWTRKLQDLIMPPIVEEPVEDESLERGEAEAEMKRASFHTVSAARTAHEEMAEEAEDIRVANGGTIHLTRSYEQEAREPWEDIRKSTLPSAVMVFMVY